MNLDRLRWGEWIAAIFGLNLVLVVFRAWYKVSGGDGRVTAWDSLDSGRYLLLAVAVIGIFYLLIRASEEAGQIGDLPLGWITAGAGLAGTLYVAYRLATPPSDALDPDTGLYLGLLSTLGVAVGGLLGAREPGAAGAGAGGAGDGVPDASHAPGTEPLGALVPDSGGTWSAAPPAASTGGWSPAAPAPPATAAGADFGDVDRPVRAGDQVALTTGGARFPAGTIAEVVEVFGGGALVEVRAADGVAERFEVPEEAYERVPAGGAGVGTPPTPATSPSTGGQSWSPAMPEPASAGGTEDWGFDDEPAAADAPAKTAWWKRDIGGGKKDDVAAVAAGAAAGAAVASHGDDDGDEAGEKKPGFFSRLFGGGKKDEHETVQADALADEPLPSEPEPEPTPAADVSGIGTAAESDTAVHERALEPEASAGAGAPTAGVSPAVADPEPIAAPDASSQPPEPVVEATPEPEPVVEATPEREPTVEVTPDPVVEATPEPEPPVEAAPEPPAPEPEPPAPEPEPPAPEPEPPAPAAEAPPGEPEPVPAPPDPDEPAGPVVETAPAAAADADDEPAPAKKSKPRKRSSGSRKVPKAAVEAAASEDGPPKVGDQVQLKVSGGKYDAGTKGTVVDVFSAGVIVELSDEDGRTERLDLPFEAVSPADT